MSNTVNRWSKAIKLIIKHKNAINKGKERFIGEDHLGNQYFEAEKPNHSRPIQRYHVTKKSPENFDELIEAVHVPPAWDAWLRFRRSTPPSNQEVLEGEEYFRMQQEMASKKKSEQDRRLVDDQKQTSECVKSRTVPSGIYREGR